MSDLTRRQLLGRAAIAAGAAATMGSTGTALAATSKAAAPPHLPDPWQMFNCGAWNDSTLFTFGSAASGAAEIGEVMNLVQVVRERTGDPVNPTTAHFNILVYEWQRLAARLERRAAQAQAAGNLVSARQQWLRASTYQAQALFFVLGTSRPEREEAIFRQCEQDWMNGIGL